MPRHSCSDRECLASTLGWSRDKGKAQGPGRRIYAGPAVALWAAGGYAKSASSTRPATRARWPTASGPIFACTIDMSYLLWARSIDIRMLKESQIEDGWIRIKPSKTQKPAARPSTLWLLSPKADVVPPVSDTPMQHDDVCAIPDSRGRDCRGYLIQYDNRRDRRFRKVFHASRFPLLLPWCEFSTIPCSSYMQSHVHDAVRRQISLLSRLQLVLKGGGSCIQ